MTTIKTSKRRVLLIASTILIAVASVLGVAVLSARRQQPKTKPRKEWLTSVPQLGSKVKNLEIINPTIVRQDTDYPGVAFEVWNKSNRAVMAIEIACGNGSIATDGLEDDQNPRVIIEPYGTLSAEMAGELTPGHPIVITAAIFDDKKEEGDKTSLDRMHRIRARKKARLKKQKEQSAPERSPTQ